jgi:hypothetical protein
MAPMMALTLVTRSSCLPFQLLEHILQVMTMVVIEAAQSQQPLGGPQLSPVNRYSPLMRVCSASPE